MLTKFPFARIPIFMALCLFFKLRFPFSTMNPSRNRAFTCFLTPHSKTVFILTFSLEKPKKKSSQVVCERQWNYMSVENCSHPPRFLNHSWTHPAAAHLHVSWHTAKTVLESQVVCEKHVPENCTCSHPHSSSHQFFKWLSVLKSFQPTCGSSREGEAPYRGILEFWGKNVTFTDGARVCFSPRSDNSFHSSFF